MDQSPAADRRWKKKVYLCFGKDERCPAMRDDPCQQNDDQQRAGRESFHQLKMICGNLKRSAGVLSHSEPKSKKVKIKIEAAHNAADEILRFLEPLQPNLQPVDQCVKLQVEKREHQGLTSDSPVARKKTSSRFASGDSSA